MISIKRCWLLKAALMAVIMLALSCESNFKQVQNANLSEFVPSGEADKINLKYTDSGRITAILISPKMKEYGTVAFPFTEFPKGVDVTLYDKNGKRTFVTADQATSYKITSIIDLEGNVKIRTEAGQILETNQLYFDQRNEWFFTNKRYTFTDPKGVSYGKGIDFSKDFKIINSQSIVGEVDSAE